jgi:hypothetical protein
MKAGGYIIFNQPSPKNPCVVNCWLYFSSALNSRSVTFPRAKYLSFRNLGVFADKGNIAISGKRLPGYNWCGYRGVGQEAFPQVASSRRQSDTEEYLTARTSAFDRWKRHIRPVLNRPSGLESSLELYHCGSV